VSKSTTLPLPSSPHWVPSTTTFLAMNKTGVVKLGEDSNKKQSLAK
jgi:hypothetical protein